MTGAVTKEMVVMNRIRQATNAGEGEMRTKGKGNNTRGPSWAVIIEFFIAGTIALFGWYVVNQIMNLLPATTPWTFVLIPYSVLVVGLFFIGLGILSVIVKVRRKAFS